MTIPFCFYEQKSNKKASKSATAIRTISARLRQSSTELEELGEDPLSSDYDTKSKYREKLMALSGVDILEADQETYKSTTQILRELAAAWDEISDIDKSSIVYMTAGVRQTNVFNSLMTQWSEAEKVLETTANAEGAMAKAYESYTDSIEGRMNTLIATFQDLSVTLLDSELIKGVVTGITEIVDLIDTLIEEVGLLGPALAGVGIYQFIQSVGALKTEVVGAAVAITDLTKVDDVVSALHRYDEAVAKLVLSKSALVEKDQKQALNFIKETKQRNLVLQTYEREIINSAILAGAKEKEAESTIKNAFAAEVVEGKVKGVTKAKIEEGLVTAGLSTEKAKEIAARYANSAAIGTENAALVAQEGIYSTLFKRIWAFAAANAVLVTSISAITIAIGALGVAYAISQKKLAKSIESYQNLTEEVESLEQELTVIRDRIKEINELETPTLADQEELEKLQAQNEELERQLKLKKILKEESASEAEERAMKWLDDQYYATTKTVTNPYTGEVRQEVVKEYDNWYDYMSQQVSEYNLLQRQLKEAQAASLAATTADDIKNTTDEVERLEGLLFDKLNHISNKYNQLNDTVVAAIGESADSEEAKAFLELWELFKEKYDWILNGFGSGDSAPEIDAGVSKDTAKELGDLTETLDGIVEKYDLLKDAQDQFKESGTLSAATLSGIMEKFESMEEPVALYIAGLKTEKELLKDLQNAYDAEEQDYYDTIKSKLEYSAEYCDSLDEDQIKLIKDFGATYDVDFGNFKTLAEAKIKLQEKLTEKLGEINAKYVGASLEELKAYRDLLFNSAGFKDYEQDLPESMRTGNDLQDAMLAAEYKHKKYFEEVAALNNTINAMEKAMKAFDELAYDPDGWDPSKFSEDAQDAAKEAEDAFEKLKEKLKDWFSDMEFQVEIRFNAGDIEGTTELYQQMIAKARELLDSAYNMGLNIEDEWVQELITKVNTYKKALADLRTEEYDKLIEYNDKFDVWNHVSYSKLDKLEEKLEDINEQYREGLITYQDYYDAFMDTAGQIYDIQKESLETLLEEVMNALEADNEAQVEALEEQADAIQKIIDLKKQLLEETRDQEDHEREVADKVRTIAKLQERISQLKLDDSREATAERLALEEELYTAQQELAELQGDYAVDQTINALDKQAEEYENYYDDQIEAIEDQIDQETELRQKAIELINSDYRNMMNDVKGYFKELGYTISDDLLEPLRQGLDLVSQYGDYTGATGSISQNAAAGLQSPKTVASIVAQMKQNSAAWHGADKNEQNRLSDKNANLGQQLREMGLDVWRENSTGIWWIRINGQKQKLFDAYHIGGTVGAPTAKSNEIFAMLKKGEVVLTGNQQDSLLNIIKTARDFVDNMMATTFGAVTNRMKSFSPATGYNTGIGTYAPNIEVNIAHNGSMSDADAKRYGNTIAETALDKLWETMQKRGMTK